MGNIGSVIGKVKDTFKTTNEAGESVTISVEYDFTRSSDNDIKEWLCGNRRIAMQRPLRKLSAKEIESIDGTIIPAENAGKKVVSKEEYIQGFMNLFIGQGIDEVTARKLAETAVDNPELLKIDKTSE